MLLRKLHEIVDGDTKLARFLNGCTATLIIINIACVILDSYSSVHNKYFTLFQVIEIYSIIRFSIEYILRAIVSPFNYDNEKYRIKYIIKYMVSPIAIIDLASVLPFYLPIVFVFDFRLIRIFRVFRLIRVLKIQRYSKSLDLITRVLKSKKTDLIMTIIVIAIMLLLCRSIMYYAENDIQPNIFPNIVESTIWALKTMVFLGYEIPPLTIVGKVFGLLITLLGLGWIALPISIISSGFVEEMHKDEDKVCPHCGNKMD